MLKVILNFLFSQIFSHPRPSIHKSHYKKGKSIWNSSTIFISAVGSFFFLLINCIAYYLFGNDIFAFFFFFAKPCGILIPWPGTEPGPWLWKYRVLTTRLPGNSRLPSFLKGVFAWYRIVDVACIFSEETLWTLSFFYLCNMTFFSAHF